MIDVPQRGQWWPVQESSSWPHAQISLRAGGAVSSGWRLAQAWRSVVIVVSTDMTHCGRPYRYRPTAGVTAHPFSYQEDQHAIDRMLMLDPQGLYQVVRQRHLTVCGVIPITAALPACQEPGATSATLVR